MFHRILGTAAAVLLALAVPASADESDARTLHYETPGEVPLLAPTYGVRTAPVLLTDGRLSPRRVEVQPGQTVVWTSMARHPSRIVFEREVARSMVCHSLVNFEIDGDRLRSAPLHTGERASFCRLSPGTYRYRVVREGLAERPTQGGLQLSNRLEGVLVVLPGDAPVAGEVATR